MQGDMRFRLTKSPSELLALTNCVFVNPDDFPDATYISINKLFYFTIK